MGFAYVNEVSMIRFLLSVFLLLSVSTSIAQTAAEKGRSLLDACIEAHGGLDRWQQFGGLSYTLTSGEREVFQLTDLRSRKAYHRFPDFEMGYDGKVGWATTEFEKVPAKSPLFYHNIDFYFFGLPFLLADPGTVHEYLGQQTLDGKVYEAVKVSFENGVGIVSDDVYVLYMDATTFQMEILLYSVTYFNRENADKFSAKKYSDWQAVKGLVVPGKMENFGWDGKKLGESKGHARKFSSIKFTKKQPDASRFEVPQGANVEKQK